jgi:protein-S-isoprenylcysteine O-methyltransferase Ste14
MAKDLKNDPRFANHETRPDLAGEHPQGDRLQTVVFILFIISSLIDYFFLGWSLVFRHLVPLYLRMIISLIFIIIGGYLSVTGIRTVFGTYSDEPKMINTGLFSYMRHPVYFGAILIYMGLLILVLSPLSFLVFLASVFLYNWLANYEEICMIKIFGKKYKEYMQITPKWFPALAKKRD